MKFAVKPMRHYDGAHYPSPEEPAAERERPFSLKLLVIFFALALALGLMACVDEQKAYYAKTTKRDGDTGPGDGNDGDYDILLGAPPECTPGEAFCDRHEYAECTEDWYLEYTDCDAYCQERTGMDAAGCDASLAQPCDCYDIIDGDIAECMPGDVRCVDGGTVGVCGDDHVETFQSCDNRCQEELGELGTSLGCDAAQADPCQCQYDMIDGGIAAECLPGDLACGANNTLGTCDSYFYEYIDCEQYCREVLGTSTATSQGCDATDGEDPCTCVDEEGGPG